MSFLLRAGEVFGDYPSTVWETDASSQTTWKQTLDSCKAVATGLVEKCQVQKGDVVGIISRNTRQMFEVHYAVPMAQAVLLTFNFRVDAPLITYGLEHSECKVLFVDTPFVPLVKAALAELKMKCTIVDVPVAADSERLGTMTWDDLASCSPGLSTYLPSDEWQPIAMSYTSGTTAMPKAVVVHHRGAYLMSMGSVPAWNMPKHGVYMYTVPMFHCNGWAIPWTSAILGMKLVLLNNAGITGAKLWSLLTAHRCTNFGAAPIVLNLLTNYAEKPDRIDWTCDVMTAGAPPTPATLAAMDALGFRVMQVYGLTETYGHICQCEPHDHWKDLTPAARAELQAQQGVRYPMVEGLDVWKEDTCEPVPRDGETMGEVAIRANTVMSGYLKAPEANEKAFANGWFHSGDAAVIYPSGYMQIKDRFKDIIITGGENVSSVEVEACVAKHPAIMNAAVVAMPSEKWGETPCCFYELKDKVEEPSDKELQEHCKANMARFKCPGKFIKAELPKTATGKIQKFKLRDQAKALASEVYAK